MGAARDKNHWRITKLTLKCSRFAGVATKHIPTSRSIGSSGSAQSPILCIFYFSSIGQFVMGESNALNESNRRINVCVAFYPSSMRKQSGVMCSTFTQLAVIALRTAVQSRFECQHESCLNSRKQKKNWNEKWNDSIQATIPFHFVHSVSLFSLH